MVCWDLMYLLGNVKRALKLLEENREKIEKMGVEKCMNEYFNNAIMNVELLMGANCLEEAERGLEEMRKLKEIAKGQEEILIQYYFLKTAIKLQSGIFEEAEALAKVGIETYERVAPKEQLRIDHKHRLVVELLYALVKLKKVEEFE